MGAFVEQRFFEGRIRMVNGFADWVVAGDTWWIPEHRGVWRNLPGRPVIRALTLFVLFFFFFSSAWPTLLEKLKIYYPMDIKKRKKKKNLLIFLCHFSTSLTPKPTWHESRINYYLFSYKCRNKKRKIKYLINRNRCCPIIVTFIAPKNGAITHRKHHRYSIIPDKSVSRLNLIPLSTCVQPRKPRITRWTPLGFTTFIGEVAADLTHLIIRTLVKSWTWCGK